MTMINAFDGSGEARLDPQDKALIARRASVLGPAYRLFYEEPLHIQRGKGVWLWDRRGRRYLDAYNNVASVGHCHPRVVEAITQQLGVLNTHTRYLHENVVTYAERLLATMPDALGHVMFTCTGSEANDLALRIARSRGGRQGVVVTRLAYHGLTEAVSELSPSLGEFVPRGPRVRLIEAPDGLRVPAADQGARLAADLARAIAGMRAEGIEPAAFIADTIFSSDGLHPEPAGFLRPAVEELTRLAPEAGEDEALDAIAGYTIANDLTTRELVFRRDMPEIGTDWLRAKNAPGFLPLGPWIVPKEDAGEVSEMRVTLELDGKAMQDESTKDMLFGVAALVAAVSQTVQLLPGDLILTGSPAGNGMHWGRLLRDGDVMTSTITGLGYQQTPVVDAS